MIIQEDVYLEHYGKKGMKWGVRNSSGGSSKGGVVGAFSRNRALNKAHREQVKANKAIELAKNQKKYAPPKTTKTFDKSTHEGKYLAKQYRRQQIDRARARIESGALKADYKEAKTQYKQDKVDKGSKHAKAILKDKKHALRTDAETANQVRDGKELTGHIVKALASTALSVA